MISLNHRFNHLCRDKIIMINKPTLNIFLLLQDTRTSCLLKTCKPNLTTKYWLKILNKTIIWWTKHQKVMTFKINQLTIMFFIKISLRLDLTNNSANNFRLITKIRRTSLTYSILWNRTLTWRPTWLHKDSKSLVLQLKK